MNASAVIETHLVGRLPLTIGGSRGARPSTGETPDIVERMTQAAVSKKPEHRHSAVDTPVAGHRAMLANEAAKAKDPVRTSEGRGNE